MRCVAVEYIWFDSSSMESTDAAEDFESVVDTVLRTKKAASGSRPATQPIHSSEGSSAKRLGNNGARREKKSDMGQEILEGFIMSAGLDQRVLLWNAKGQCVGEFGSFGWDINNESTWFKKNESLLLMNIAGRKVKSKGSMVAAHSADASSFDYVDYDDSAHILTSFARHKNHTVKELSSYVEELTKKILNKPPSYLDVSKQFSSILETHPIKIIKDGKYRPTI